MGGRKPQPRYGLILINPNTYHVFVVRRINFSLYDRLNNNKVFSHSEMILSMYPGLFTECMLEFPKGNKEKKETGLECALREFSEESGISIDLETGFELKKFSIKITKLTIRKLVTEHYIGQNNIKYVFKYYITLFDFDIPKDTIIIETRNRRVLADLFNVVMCTKWVNIRRVFEIQNMHNIVHELDIICGLDKVNISKN